MAIDPRISLAVQGPNVGAAFQNALTNVQNIQRGQREAELQPLRNQLLQAQTQQAQTSADTARDQQRFASVAQGALEIQPSLVRSIETSNTAEVESLLTNRIASLQARQQAGENVDANDSIEALQILKTQGPQALLNSANDAISAGQRLGVISAPGEGVANIGFGAQQTFKDEKGNLFFGTQRRNPTTGAVESALSPVSGSGEPEGQLSLVSSLGQTAAEKQASTVATAAESEAGKLAAQLETKPTIKATEEAQTQAIKKSGQAFDRLEKIGVAISNIDEGIKLIDEGASTGVVVSKLPSVKKSSIELDNLQKRLGLDVIGNTTFGALSESELKFALDSALPKNLEPADLRNWLVRKKTAQEKLSTYVGEVATFLGTPGNTVADFIELQKVGRLEQEQPTQVDPQVAPTQSTQAQPANVGRFQIEVVQ